MSRNRFDLDTVLSNLPVPKQTNFTDLSQQSKSKKHSANSNKLSSNYVEIKKSNLNSIPIGTYLRYFDADGNLKPGGGKLKSLGQNAEGESIITFGNFNASTKKYYVWNVKLTDVSKIYKYVKEAGQNSAKGEPGQSQPSQSQPSQFQQQFKPIQTEEEKIISQLGDKMLFNDTDSLKQKIDSLEIEIQRISTDLKKIFILVQRLHTAVFKPS